MKTKQLLAAFAALIFIFSCQKELEFELDGNAHGSLKADISGDCLPSTVNGIFKEDSLLSSTNFIDVQVNVAVTGSYDIKSDTVNGFSFRGTGTFDSTGNNPVRLFGTGKPITAGLNHFTITFDSTTCVVDVTVIAAGTGPATFTMANSTGACSGALSNGTYIQGTALDINNSVNITVDVTATGTYSITTVSTDGMVFSAVGAFSSVGSHNVTLNGTGTPTTAGIFNITAASGSTTCTFSITVLPSTGGGVAVFTLDVTGNDCSGATYSGTYDAGTALNSSNVVVVNVTVISAGTYTITTPVVNGVVFSASGTFSSAVQQPVTLTGSGTPVNGGIFNYAAASGASTCTFSITFTGTPANEDYVPETSFSNWSSKLVGGTPADTTYEEVSTNTIIINSNTYRIFETKVLGMPVDSSFHRKNGGMYYVLFDQTYGFDNTFSVDGLILDSNLAVNSIWTVDLGNNTWNGLPATGKVNCVMFDKGATVTIASNTYADVIKVKYTFSYDVGSGDTDLYATELWFAKGKGVIYEKVNDLPATFTAEQEVTRVQVF